MNSQLGRSVIVVACVCLVTGLSAGAAAQGLSDMRGTVVDTSGGALPGVSIVITNQASGTFREVTSNVDGSWYVPGLTPLMPLMIAGLAETVLPFTAVSVSITILFFTSFYDTAAILEGRKVLDCLRRSVEFVLTHTRECVIFYLVVIIITAAIVFGMMILWTAALYDKVDPLASYNATQMQSFTPDQFMAILGPDGMAVSAFFLLAGLAILVSVVLGFKACFYRDGSAASPQEEPAIGGEYDSKGRWYKY